MICRKSFTTYCHVCRINVVLSPRQVFEVNASSRRSGKHILAQLQEATQSHQVAKASMDDVYNSMLAQGKGM